MIDFHCHLLPALDDGAITIDDSLAMARALAEFGYTTVCCTPHCIKGYYDLTPQKVRDATLMLQADLDSANIRLELRPGMEYMLDECFSTYADDLLPLGDTKLILCEAPPQAHPGIVHESLELIIEQGFVPLIAHPERTQYFYEMLSRRVVRDAEPSEARDTDILNTWGTVPFEAREEENLGESRGFLKKFWPFGSRSSRPVSRIPRPGFPDLPENCLFQGNLGSFTGFYGEKIQRQAYELLKLGVYSALASDLHDGSSAHKVLVAGEVRDESVIKKALGLGWQ